MIRKFKKLLFYKLLKNIILILKDILNSIRNSKLFRWFFYFFKFYAIVFSLLGSGFMGLNFMDLQTYSYLVYDTIENIYITITHCLRSFLNWLNKKIFGEGINDSYDHPRSEGIRRPKLPKPSDS